MRLSHLLLLAGVLIFGLNAQAQKKVSISGKLSQFDQQIGSGIWDYGDCLGNDSGLPPLPGSPYVSAIGGEVVLVNNIETYQKTVHYDNPECQSGKGYTIVRTGTETRKCAAATYNHFCKGAPSKMVIKLGVWDYGNCAGGDRNFCPGMKYNSTNGATTTYKSKHCASGVARCTVDSAGWGVNECEIARYIHTCE